MKARPWIEAVGIGRRSAEPDGLELLLELSAREPTVAEALDRLAAATGRLANILEGQGIPASDCHTSNLDVDRSSNRDKCAMGLRTTDRAGGLRGDPGSCFTATGRAGPGLTVGSTGS